MKDSDSGSGVRIGFCGLLTPVWASALFWIGVIAVIALIERRI